MVANFVDYNHKDYYQHQEQVEWWKDYENLPRETGTIATNVSEAIQYEEWINEPMETVINRLTNYYGEPLLEEISNAVSDFKQVPTDWHYSYKVDNVYLLQESDEKTIIIAEISELLVDKVVGKGLALITLDNNYKIVEQVFRWEY